MAVDFNPDELLWAQKYRPRRIADAILPEKTKKIFQNFVDNKELPNLLLAGPHGMGKTTAAIAMLEELGCDYIKINGSLDAGIDVLRHDISRFASSVSFSGGHKYVLLDEADAVKPPVQAALRAFMEDFSANCGFIFTCNYKRKIIEPLRESRLTNIDYKIEPEEVPLLKAQFFKRVKAILEQEQIEYEIPVIVKIVDKYFPDFRKTLNELQKYASVGKIDEGIFAVSKNESLDPLFGMLKAKKFTDMRKWMAQNSDMDYTVFYRELFDKASTFVELKTMPGFVVTVAKYQYQHAFVADPEINAMALLCELMLECSFI